MSILLLIPVYTSKYDLVTLRAINSDKKLRDINIDNT